MGTDPKRNAPIDWDDLRCFLAAARAGTLSGAARALGVEHSTLGRRLTALERALGAPLLTRGPQGLALTELGRRATPLAEEVERAVDAFVSAAIAERARVRVAVPSGFARVLAPHLPRFAQRHPGVTLELLGSSQLADLARGEADFAVRLAASRDPDLVVRTIGEAGSSLYASDAYLTRRPAPIDPAALEGHDLLGYDPALASAPAGRWLAEHGRGANVVMRCREMTEMVAACAAGVGLALLPCVLADAEPALRRLTPLVLGGARPVTLVHRREALLSAPVRGAIAFVVEVLKEQAARLAGAAPAAR